jgi:hypothetical protein
MRSVFFGMLGILSSAGCASLDVPPREDAFGVFSEPRADQAHVHFFRNSSLLAGGGPTQVFIDEREVARLRNRGYTMVVVPPGCYRFDQVWPEQRNFTTIPLDHCVAAGDVEVLRIMPNRGTYRGTYFGGMAIESGGFHAKLIPVGTSGALTDNLIQECRMHSPLHRIWPEVIGYNDL